jgi:hypothetical protein
MIVYQNNVWSIKSFCRNQIFQGMFRGGINDHLCKEMDVWLLWRKSLISDKSGMREHYEIAWLWSEHNLQPYEIFCPD